MPANWSLFLNIILLIGVVFSISRLIKVRREQLASHDLRPSIGKRELNDVDDIIAIRKISDSAPVIDKKEQSSPSFTNDKAHSASKEAGKTSDVQIMLFLLAKDDEKLAGYELLQTLLAAGLRFGDGHLFHRHQNSSGQGPVLFSLAAATPSGIFDLQNIGAFSVNGLCLFMHGSNNPTIDAERFELMLNTAKQLSEDLNTHLLDDMQRPLSEQSIRNYCELLNIATAPAEEAY